MFEGLFQPTHLIIIRKLPLSSSDRASFPKSGGSLGKAVRGFKKAMTDPTEGEGTNNLHIEGKD